MGARATASFAITIVLLLACGRRPGEPERQAPPSVFETVSPSKAILHDFPGGAGNPGGAPAASKARIVPSPFVDEAYASDEMVRARRLVYRVTLHVPAGYGAIRSTLPRASAELYIDVSDERLRARFEGAVWPVPASSEVRINNHSGAYAFDEHGGRPLAPGELARWFYGGALSSRHLPPAGVLPAATAERSGPGSLVCAFLSEWASEPREIMAHRCDGGGAPLGFRIGPWRAERTADVPSELPRRALRADHVDPPEIHPERNDRMIVTPVTISRLKRTAALPQGTAGLPLDVKNGLDARALLLVEGMPVRWLEPGEHTTIVGLASKGYRVAGMRAFGNPVRPPRYVALPAILQL